jgi:hypothetical protein
MIELWLLGIALAAFTLTNLWFLGKRVAVWLF